MAVSHILIVIIAAIGLTIFAERRQIQAPLLLAIVGLAASMIPALSRIEFDPEIILGLVLPPLLYSAALEFSFISFMKRIGSILNLGIVLVVVTTAAGGAVVGWMLPALSLPLAFVLAAAVAPTDAVSAVAIGGKLGLPKRMMTILKGESLINDAAALTLFSAAVAAATGGHTLIKNGTLYFLYAALVGVIIGIGIGAFVHVIRRRLANPSLVTALAIVTPFAAYALAEEMQASGVIAVVFAGFSLGHNATDLSFAGRIQEREVWRVFDTLLEAFVFAYMGLQFRFVLEDAVESGYSMTSLAMTAAALLVTVVVVRLVWIVLTASTVRGWLRIRPGGARYRAELLGWRENLVLSWAGMRGVVTLAAAAGTPLVTVTGATLSGREAIVPIAFAVAMGTLLLQGLTLPWLIRRLDIRDAAGERHQRKQMEHARDTIQKAAFQMVSKFREQLTNEADIALAERWLEHARQEAELRASEAEAGIHDKPAARRAGTILRIAGPILAAQRRALIEERNAGRLDDDMLREMLQDIDFEQAALSRRVNRQ